MPDSTPLANATAWFMATSAILLIGYVAHALAQRGRFPDLLVLVLLGAILGPINDAWLHIASLSRGVGQLPLAEATPLFGALALAIIMFDAGMDLPVRQVAEGLRLALPHTAGIFVLTTTGIAACTWLLLGVPWLPATLLGVILGGVSTAVVVSAVKNTPLASGTRTLVTLECVLVDVLTIAAAVTLLEILRGGDVDAAGIVRSILITLAMGAILGGLAGLLQVALLPRTRAAGNHYILTLAMLLGVYGLTEYVAGSGPIAAFAFGLTLGNSRQLHSTRLDTAPELSHEIHRFHAQATFLVRTFFFVLLGLTFSPRLARLDLAPSLPGFSRLPSPLLLVLALAGTLAVILAARRLVVRLTIRDELERPVVSALVGRGLGSAVLATLPFTLPEMRDEASAYAQAMGPYQELFPSFVGAVVVLTILATTVGLWRANRPPAPTTTKRPA